MLCWSIYIISLYIYPSGPTVWGPAAYCAAAPKAGPARRPTRAQGAHQLLTTSGQKLNININIKIEEVKKIIWPRISFLAPLVSTGVAEFSHFFLKVSKFCWSKLKSIPNGHRNLVYFKHFLERKKVRLTWENIRKTQKTEDVLQQVADGRYTVHMCTL